MNLQQQFMHQALERVQTIAGERPERRKAFGGICHAVPGWILANGLAETVAFIEAKGAGGGTSGWAYGQVSQSIAGVLGVPRANLTARIAGPTMQQYMIDTLTLLDAWVFYKRFAVSMLGVQPGEDLESLEGEATADAAEAAPAQGGAG
jgi:CRISPR-associated protein Cmr5